MNGIISLAPGGIGPAMMCEMKVSMSSINTLSYLHSIYGHHR